MNQKDYKAISEILKKALIKCDSLDFKDKIIARGIIIGIAKDKADYFEKEDNAYQTNCLRIHGAIDEGRKFNREQFLKDCGVN